MPPQPKGRTDRVNSKEQSNLQSTSAASANAPSSILQNLQTKRKYHLNSIKRIEKNVNDKSLFEAWTVGELNQRVKKLEDASVQFNEAVVDILCEDDDAANVDAMENDVVDDLVMDLKALLNDRINAISAPKAVQEQQPKPYLIEVQQTDATGNIHNTWGTFDGDYSKWKSFRDRWMTIHENTKVKTIVKFQNLKTACIKAAEGALGEWDLTEENYYKAWERLQTIYEDDYMQVQEFMRKLSSLPHMQSSSSQSIRKIIDTVHKHIHGLERYVDTGVGYPYVVFAVIERMDPDTYRAWEKHRPSLAKSTVNETDSNVGEEQLNPNRSGKHIPTWQQLEEFLESEVTIRVHAEKRNESNTDGKISTKRNRNSNNKSQSAKREVPEFLKCVLCDNIHPIFRCPSFVAMNLNGRKNHVREYNLCDKCLRKSHTNRCERKQCNDPCPKCKPETCYHNSAICPNAELDLKMAMLALEENKQSRKRKHSGNYAKNGPKRKRTNDDTKMHSTVNKIGDWSMTARESNAIKSSTFKGNNNQCRYAALLATVNMKIHAKNNIIVNCRAITDTGATLNCISSQYVINNALPVKRCQRRILGVTGPELIKHKIDVDISPWFPSDVSLKTEFFVINSLDGIYPPAQIEVDKSQIMHLKLADEKFDTPAAIDAILGVEVYSEIIGTDLFKHKDGAIMQSTSFGNIILGKFRVKSLENDDTEFKVAYNVSESTNELSDAISKFWEIENVSKLSNKDALSEKQKAVEEFFLKTYYRDESGRYVVTMPIDTNKELGDSRKKALSQFLQLERKFQRNVEYKRKYIEFMREYQQLGYMLPASAAPNSNERCYLPHHAVKDKFRVVHNGSAITSTGESLNSIQMIGAKLQYDLQLQIMRFRRNKIGVATDISKMFNRVRLNPKQWNLHRIFWRESPNDELKEYVLTVVTFGMSSSTYNAVRTLIQNARDYKKQFPEASNVIEKCFYIDDGVFGRDTIQELKLLCKEVEFVLSQGGFSLKGWASNSREVEEYMNCSNSNALSPEDEKIKVLGLWWHKLTDDFSIVMKIKPIPRMVTKRAILSQAASFYDPTGMMAPVIVSAKILIQDIWRLKELSWDDKLPADIDSRWRCIHESLPILSEFKVKRWLGAEKYTTLQIHAFCDASEKAYGTVIYMRTTNSEGKINVSFLASKSKVAPLTKVTIPNLELLAAVMLSEQLEAIVDACEFKTENITLWSDSQVVIHWLAKSSDDLKAVVARRVNIIREKTKRYEWKHVSSEDNPADLVSRGMKIKDFIKSKFWLEGPSWLKNNESTWPKPKMILSEEIHREIEKGCKAKKAAAKILFAIDEKLLYDRIQDYDKLLNVTAYAMRFIKIKCKKQTELIGKGYPSSVERKEALEFWIRVEQSKAFKKELNCFNTGDKMPKKTDLNALRPMLDKNGLIRVGGRIDKANVAYQKRHQYIIPHKSRLSFIILNYAHKATLHGGAQLMMQFIRKIFWIPKLRAEIKQFSSTCKECVRQAHVTVKQIMAELPEIRVKPAPPFQNVGVDMAGPFSMRVTDKLNTDTRARKLPDIKGYIAVFVCLVTRAVHLEPTEGMSTDDFLNAYSCFVSRRGNPEKIYSDHGSNFLGANNELQYAYNVWKHEKIQHLVHLRGTEWHFIKPSAPHEGGIWEAAVKSMKFHLKRVMGTQRYSIKGIHTLLANIEACLNSRPLCAMSDDPNDCEMITPAHFLIHRSLTLPMQEKVEKTPFDIKRLHTELQFQIQAFWKQWSNDYLHSLVQLPKWREEQDNLRIGSLVLIKSDNIPPTYWAMGRVKTVNVGTDGKVRSAVIKTQNSELERSVRKLCVLPTGVELSYWS